MHYLVTLWNSLSMHLGLFQSFLQCFDMFVEQAKEIMYRKWNMALTGQPDLDMRPACLIP